MQPTNTDRAEQFKADMAAMKLKTGTASKDATLQAVGVILMIAGIAMAIIAWRASLNVTVTKTGSNADVLDASSYGTQALAGVAITVAGAAVYLRCALAKFLRFWLLRQIQEGRDQIEAVANAISNR